MKYIKQHKSIFAVAGIALLLFGIFSVSNMIAMNNTESTVKAEARENMGQDTSPSDVSRECAKYYLDTMSDCPLLKEAVDSEYVNYGDSCLENAVNDVNVTNTAAGIIKKVCKENGIDAQTAKVKDLSEEQIMEIDREAFKTSKHGK